MKPRGVVWRRLADVLSRKFVPLLRFEAAWMKAVGA
jgi:hypothetical protein